MTDDSATGVHPFEDEIRAYEEADRYDPPPEGAILFVGSSSVRMWESLERDFAPIPVLNRGFGGSQIEDSTHFAPRIVFPYRPSMIVLYAGDNDLASGKSPGEVFEDYRAFVRTVRRRLPETPVAFVSIKPSPSRRGLMGEQRAANALVREYAGSEPGLSYLDVFTPMLGPGGDLRPELYIEDELHMSPAGYAIWSAVIGPRLVMPGG